ncbi:aminotransferase class-III [Colletotrichum sublineola]|nr:aminotransferase class-III [Colletotrichum sublineola]
MKAESCPPAGTGLSSASAIGQQLDEYVKKYVTENEKSRQVNNNASGSLPGGTTRSVLHYHPFPLAFSGGHECHLTSVDGHEYLDFVSEYCAGMFGHSHPKIIAAIESVAKNGFTLGGPSPKEGELGALLVERFPSIDAIRFCNSGTEANTMAIATALHFVGRRKILVCENGYHGGTLAFTPGNPLILPHDFIYGRYNDIEFTRPKITEDVGVIIVEPMQGAAGMIEGSREFLNFLRDEATRVGAVLIFDEVITSRLKYGGLQEHFGITPDMTTIGKHFGGGFSFGAFGGRKEIMDLYDPESPRCLFHSGTWNNNLFSMTAGIAATKLLSREALERNNELGDKLRSDMAATFASKDASIVTLTGFGSAIGVHFNGPLADKLQDLFFFYLLEKRIYVGRRGFLALNLTHGEEHTTRVLEAVREFCDKFL